MKKKDLDVTSYTKEFQGLCLISKQQKDELIKVARYLGGLKWNIQEELNLWAPTIVQRCHQPALKVEEKNKRKGYSNFKDRGKGINQRGGEATKVEEVSRRIKVKESPQS